MTWESPGWGGVDLVEAERVGNHVVERTRHRSVASALVQRGHEFGLVVVVLRQRRVAMLGLAARRHVRDRIGGFLKAERRLAVRVRAHFDGVGAVVAADAVAAPYREKRSRPSRPSRGRWTTGRAAFGAWRILAFVDPAKIIDKPCPASPGNASGRHGPCPATVCSAHRSSSPSMRSRARRSARSASHLGAATR